MKICEVQKLSDAGLITEEQRQRIVEHFHLRDEGGGRFLAIVATLGAVLITAGIVLLISAHWNEIADGVKIAAGLSLMLGAHASGWWLREVRRDFRRTAEALHLAGSGLFLANIALIGQIYNLSSRPPNAILLWWAGIAALPWLLRSKAQHILALLAFGVWFGLEAAEPDSLFGRTGLEPQPMLYAMLGLIYLGCGYCLRTTLFAEFAPATEKLGLLGFLVFFYPLTWRDFSGAWSTLEGAQWSFPALAVAALLLLAGGLRNLRELSLNWRWIWLGTLASLTVLAGTVWFGCWMSHPADQTGRHFFWGSQVYLFATLALFLFCLVQMQVGVRERSPFMVNLAVAFVALDIIAAYIGLLGSMAQTGLMFLISGVLLILLGVYLEKRRRAYMRQIRQPQTEGALP